jgi:hypothetical protein
MRQEALAEVLWKSDLASMCAHYQGKQHPPSVPYNTR